MYFLEYAFTENKLSAEYIICYDHANKQVDLLMLNLQAIKTILEKETGFGTPWNLFALNRLPYFSFLKSNTKLFGLIGERNSVGYCCTECDAIIPATNDYANNVFIKILVSKTSTYHLYSGQNKNTLAFGVRAL
jgi:Fe(3+) dicitrate transport protein